MCDGRINLLHWLCGQCVENFIEKMRAPQATVIKHHIWDVDNFGNFLAAVNSNGFQ